MALVVVLKPIHFQQNENFPVSTSMEGVQARAEKCTPNHAEDQTE